MTGSGRTTESTRRRFVVPDLHGEVVAATGPLEDVLLALAAPVDEPDDPLAQIDLTPADVATLEIVSAGAHALGLIRLLMDRAPAIELRRPDGTAHERLRLVDVPAGQIEAVGAATEVLRTASHAGDAAIVADGLQAAADHLRTSPDLIVDLAVRTHRVCDLPWDGTCELVAAALERAGTCEEPDVLSDVEDTACRHLEERLLAAWRPRATNRRD